MFALLIFMPRFKSINFYQNKPKITLFLPKNLKFSSAGGYAADPRTCGGWGLCFQTPILQQLWALPLDPQLPLVTGRSSPRPP